MNRTIIVDGALGGIYDRIGRYLTQAGLEDTSGARRFYLELLRVGEFEKIAKLFKVNMETIKKEFGDLPPSERNWTE